MQDKEFLVPKNRRPLDSCLGKGIETKLPSPWLDNASSEIPQRRTFKCGIAPSRADSAGTVTGQCERGITRQ